MISDSSVSMCVPNIMLKITNICISNYFSIELYKWIWKFVEFSLYKYAKK